MSYEPLLRPKAILEGGKAKRQRHRRRAFKKTAREFENCIKLLRLFRRMRSVHMKCLFEAFLFVNYRVWKILGTLLEAYIFSVWQGSKGSLV